MKTSTNIISETMKDSFKQAVSSQFFKAFQVQDWDALRGLISDDITWTFPGNSIVSGRVTGAEAVVKRAKIITAFGVSMHLQHTLIALNGFALSLHNKADRNGLELEEDTVIVCTLREGKIIAIKTCSSDVSAANAFFTLKNMDLHENALMPETIELSLTTNQAQKFAIASIFTSSLKNNDWVHMQSIMADEITWTLPGTSLLSGPAYGVNAVINRVQALKKFGVMFQLMHVLYGMHGFALLLHNTATRNELVLDEYVAIVFDLKDELVQSMTTHLSDVPGINAFFVPGIINNH